ncbi:MAG: response regulator [Opitutales bacterium]|nr:response regulator [Opitutales bacterium]
MNPDIDIKSTKLLIVDDDEIILIALSETLRHEGYQATTTQSPTEAIRFLHENRYSVIISDQRMAEMTGLEFLQEAARIQPNASRILITGVLTLKTIIDAINSGEIFRFIAKPWLREELLATIRNAAQRHELLETNRRLQENTLLLNTQLAEANAQLQGKIHELTAQKEELAEMHGQLRINFEHSLDLVQRIVSVYHPSLGEETRQVTELCEKMLEFASLNDDQAHVLKVAARLHNIGIIGVPRVILELARSNPELLQEHDKAVLESNAAYGQMLAHYVDPSEAVGAVIRACHERWDGQGYPDKLKGEEIPHPARLLAIAAWYVESAMSKDDRIDEILHLSGQAFDNDTVRVFLKAVRTVQTTKRAKQVSVGDLRPGMVLAKGLYSPTGMLLLPEGHMITEDSLSKIRQNDFFGSASKGMIIYS